MRLKTSFTVFGGYSVGVTPVLIPNTEVKSYRADDTAWETMWESRSPPKLFRALSCYQDRAFVCPESAPEKKLEKRVDGRELIEYNTLPLFGAASWLKRFANGRKKVKKIVDELGSFG